MPTAQDIRDRYPGVFEPAPALPTPDPLQLALDRAIRAHPEQSAWGDRYDDAVIAYAAHLRYSTTGSNVAGAIASMAVGRVSVGYQAGASGSGGNRFLDEYNAIVNSIVAFRIAGCGCA